MVQYVRVRSGSSLEKMPVYDQRQLVQASIYIKYNYTVTVTGTNGLLNGAHLSSVGPFEYVQSHKYIDPKNYLIVLLRRKKVLVDIDSY